MGGEADCALAENGAPNPMRLLEQYRLHQQREQRLQHQQLAEEAEHSILRERIEREPRARAGPACAPCTRLLAPQMPALCRVDSAAAPRALAADHCRLASVIWALSRWRRGGRVSGLVGGHRVGYGVVKGRT